MQEQCEKMADHTPLSEQQVAQLMRSLILVEQVGFSPISDDQTCVSQAKILSVAANYHMLIYIPESRAQDPGVGFEVSSGRPATKESKCVQVYTLLSVWFQPRCSLLQKSISTAGGVQSEYFRAMFSFSVTLLI